MSKISSAVIQKAMMDDRDGVKSHVVMVTQSFSPDFCSPLFFSMDSQSYSIVLIIILIKIFTGLP